jgi:putative DNA primase/helicase
MSSLPELKDQCSGKWASVLVCLGLDEKVFNGRHQPCIYCGGKDRARWIKQKEFYICNQCGSHTPSDLAIHILGRPFKETALEIRKIIGGVRMEVVKTVDEPAKNRERIERIRAGLKPINGECAASRYLANRGIKVLPGKDLYFHPGVDYYMNGQGAIHPAMVGIFRNVDGKGATLHITFLTKDGKKAEVDNQKKIMPVVLPLSGCAIKLFEPVNGVLAVAEGIESSLAVNQVDALPVWACGNAGQMAALDVPESVNELVIYADEDESFTGAQAAYTLAKRMKAKGKTVRVMRLFDMQPFADMGKNGGDFLDYCLLDQFHRFGANAQMSRTG